MHCFLHALQLQAQTKLEPLRTEFICRDRQATGTLVCRGRLDAGMPNNSGAT